MTPKDIRTSGTGVYDFPPFIIAAIRASLMRLFHFMTVWALGQGRGCQKIVRAPLVLPRMRVTAFWIRHTNSFYVPLMG